MTATPEDACPYHRPFDVTFSDCPAYYPLRFVAEDSAGRSLRPVWTCRHLGHSLRGGERGRYYARCRIGTAGDRQEWARSVGGARLQAFDDWRRISGPVVDAGVAELTRAGTEAREAGGGRPGPEMTAAVADLVARVMQLARANAALMERIGFPLDAYERMLNEWLSFVVTDAGRSEWHTPAATLELFPEPARPLLDPSYWRSTYRTG